jgi:hypothetical protein
MSPTLRKLALTVAFVIGAIAVFSVATGDPAGPGKHRRPSRFLQAKRELHIPARRTVWAYSVVPGGVRSAEEAQNAIRRDAIVRAHYEGVRTSELRSTEAGSDIHAYVSYRKNEKIYWTARRVRIPKGERVLHDGENQIRERCGNRISPTPQQPTSPDEPEAAELEKFLDLSLDTVEPSRIAQSRQRPIDHAALEMASALAPSEEISNGRPGMDRFLPAGRPGFSGSPLLALPDREGEIADPGQLVLPESPDWVAVAPVFDNPRPGLESAELTELVPRRGWQLIPASSVVRVRVPTGSNPGNNSPSLVPDFLILPPETSYPPTTGSHPPGRRISLEPPPPPDDAVTPEPGTWVLLAAGLGGLAAGKLRRSFLNRPGGRSY